MTRRGKEREKQSNTTAGPPHQTLHNRKRKWQTRSPQHGGPPAANVNKHRQPATPDPIATTQIDGAHAQGRDNGGGGRTTRNPTTRQPPRPPLVPKPDGPGRVPAVRRRKRCFRWCHCGGRPPLWGLPRGCAPHPLHTFLSPSLGWRPWTIPPPPFPLPPSPFPVVCGGPSFWCPPPPPSRHHDVGRPGDAGLPRRHRQ